MKKFILLQTTLFVLFIAGTSTAKAQETITVNDARGKGIIAGRISEAEARQEAINNAKVEALRKAGVKENLQQYEMLFKSEVNHDFSEFFSSDIQAELNGAVQKYEVIKDEKKIDSTTGLFTVEVTINATVVLYSSKPDPAFNIRINDVKGVYNEGENLAFTIFSTKKAYLHIFNITDAETSVLYPNQWEKFKEIEYEKDIRFPLGQVDYPLYASGKKPEMNRLVFVFTKEPILFLNYKGEDRITSPESIFAWIYGITPDLRRVEYVTFTIR
jgi:uncharacterized protein YehS (DUF1456 family)